ncbi:MAG: VWA domain-containing protein [Bryobacteraceae bacterium]|nr:VWA domain-containing protein [Bryobacteraceae bacterium]
MLLWDTVRATAVLALVAAPGLAQDPELVLRSTTRLVQVEVVVRDASGHPVPGLKKGDFEILEDKKPQPIQFFADYRREKPAVAELPPGMVSNRPEVTGPRRGVTVILVDSLNTGWAARARAYENLIKFLKGADPDDRVALYTLGHQFKVFHDFTGDARALLKRIEAMGNPTLAAIGEETPLDQIIPEGAALSKWAGNQQDMIGLVARATATLDTLTAIANHLGSTPGWKSLIWISSGFPLQTGMDRIASTTEWRGTRTTTGTVRSFEAEFHRAIKALSNSNVAVYPIDPAGLQVSPEFDAAVRVPGVGQPWQETNSMLRQMARRTGGKAYTDLNDILGSLKDVTEGAQSSYTLAYYAPNPRDDGEYRRIQVRVKKRGLTASHREGYFSLAADDVRQSDPEKTMLAAARDPLDSSVIGIDAQLQSPAAGSRILARVHTAELISPAGDSFVVEATAGVYQFDREGRQIGAFADKISFNCNPAQAAQLSQFGMSYDRAIAIHPEAVRVRLVVRSNRTGALGSITLPVRPTE